MTAYRLAIDYGTSYSGAAVADPATGVARPVFVNGRPTIPSIVVLDPRSGELLTGDVAENAAGIRPESVSRAPKRHLGRHDPLFREPRRIDAEDAVAATLQVLLAEAAELHDREPPIEVRLTHPARWAGPRREALRDAARRAGIGEPVLVPEPVAAAIRFAAGERIKTGEFVAVYDLGAGTFDTAVLERTPDGFMLHGEPGGLELGGDSFDERLYAYLGQQVEQGDWDAIQNSEESPWRRAQADFRRWIRLGKEALSTNPRGVDIRYPGTANRDALWLTTDDLNEQLRPDLTRTIAELEDTITKAGLGVDQISAVYLAGGSSKIPLVETLIVQHFGKSARLEDDRKQVVALGAASAPPEALRNYDGGPSARETEAQHSELREAEAEPQRQAAEVAAGASDPPAAVQPKVTYWDRPGKKAPPTTGEDHEPAGSRKDAVTTSSAGPTGIAGSDAGPGVGQRTASRGSVASAGIAGAASVIAVIVQVALGLFAGADPSPYMLGYLLVGGVVGFGCARLAVGSPERAVAAGVVLVGALTTLDLVMTQVIFGSLTAMPADAQAQYLGSVILAAVGAAVVWILATRWFLRAHATTR